MLQNERNGTFVKGGGRYGKWRWSSNAPKIKVRFVASLEVPSETKALFGTSRCYLQTNQFDHSSWALVEAS